MGVLFSGLWNLNRWLPVHLASVVSVEGFDPYIFKVAHYPEASTVLTCPGFTLAPSLDGKTAVFLDPDGSVSDFMLLANVNGAAQFTFVSDLEAGQPLNPPPPRLEPEINEPDPFVAVATSGAGARLRFTFTSDANEVAGQPSETILIAPIPEPAPLTLAGLGVLLLLCGFYLRRWSLSR